MRRIQTLLPILLVFHFCSLPPLQAQSQDPSRLTLDRLCGGEFSGEGFGPAQWLPDGSGYTVLETSKGKAGGRDLVQYEPATGAWEVLVPAERFVPEGGKKPLVPADYAWSRDGKKLLLYTNTKRVWRLNTRGDYWVLDLEKGTLKKLGHGMAPSSLMFAKFSPDGKSVAYVHEKNLYVEDLELHGIRALTTDGSDLVSNGTSDWVYEEEFWLRDGFRFSPDGKRIAFWRIDDHGVGQVPLVNNTDGLYPKVRWVYYPKTGTTNPACRVGVVSVEGGPVQWIELPGDERNDYVPWMEWAGDSETLVLQRLNRLQNVNRVLLASAADGTCTEIFRDEDEAWVDVNTDVTWIDEGRAFLWLSERSGWRKAYRVSRDGGEVRLLTPGAYDVIRLAGVDEEAGLLYFIASPENPTRRYLFSAPLSGEGKVRRITPAELPGTHSYRISPDGKWAFHTFSAFGRPPVIDLVRLPSHERVRVLAANEALREKVEALRRGEASFFRVDIGEGVLLDGWCIKPPDFDPSKRWPVLFYVYGEPAGSTVHDAWGGRYYLWYLLLAQHGYVVMSVDNRGTAVPRGRAWRKCIYRRIGILAPKDQAAAVRALLAEHPWMDAKRIGIWGWSGGGSMSLNAIFRYPDLYQTAMAVAFVSNQRYYDTIYQERYMGRPKDNEEGYREGSPITHAKNLEGNLLLVHGTGDDNCHYQSCEALVNELIAQGKYFTMMAYPNRTHSIREGRNTTRHLYGLLTRYLEANLPPGPR